MDQRYEAIVIGGSWGGMNAVIHILKDIPKCCEMPVIVVLHRLRDVESELPEIIARKTGLVVKEIDEKEPILSGNVYIAPADYHVLIESDKTFTLDYSHPVNYSRPSIDVLFQSAADVYKNKLVGILLTGANSDGSRGLKKIQEKGGLTIVQNPEEAEVDTMPRSALKLIKPMHVYKMEEIRNFLKKLR